ncbi:hypothetical protein QZM22_00755 [Burkholderia oklahomensis]|uniref:hypothetical protein n=1 Tax=Burkholderia oklahomensis TaxID=342113 RepID=UPI00264AABC7|nr:hypothetical protein [Burkholderia oklahomensis]MDN7671089.1 hypothetical protein [Burkholderia oklahomensis]
MNMRRISFSVISVGILCAATMSLANAQTAQNIDPHYHPNLARAQQQIAAAYSSIVAAQNANQYQLGGHADRAKQLLSQAAAELKAAALTANSEGR